jgi:hypothetical protein
VEFRHVGVTLDIQRIPHMLLQDWRNALPPEPPIPTQEMEYGGKKVSEQNPSHPEYVAEIEEYNYNIGMRMIEFAIDRGVVIEVDRDAVAELRSWAEQQDPPVELPKSDKVVFVSRILLPDLIDLVALRTAVFGRVVPTQEAIDQAVERFQPEVSGT